MRFTAEPLDDWLEHMRLSFENFDHRAPGGETLREAQAREVRALSRERGLLFTQDGHTTGSVSISPNAPTSGHQSAEVAGAS